MKSKKIQNKETKVKEGLELNDKDILNIIMEMEKNISTNYAIALNEASSNYMYEDFFALLEDAKDMAREIYNVAFEKGWFVLETAEDTKVEETITMLEEQLKGLEN